MAIYLSSSNHLRAFRLATVLLRPSISLPTPLLRYTNDSPMIYQRYGTPKEHQRNAKGTVDSMCPRCRQAVAILLSKPRSSLGAGWEQLRVWVEYANCSSLCLVYLDVTPTFALLDDLYLHGDSLFEFFTV